MIRQIGRAVCVHVCVVGLQRHTHNKSWKAEEGFEAAHVTDGRRSNCHRRKEEGEEISEMLL
jgi:hypothetical protein